MVGALEVAAVIFSGVVLVIVLGVAVVTVILAIGFHRQTRIK